MDGLRGEPIPTNLRLLLVLEEVAKAGEPITPTTVNETLGLPKPTIHRLFQTLIDEGFLERDLGGRAYLPGRRLRGLAGGVLSTSRIRSARQAILSRLSNKIGETCNIAMPDGDSMVYLERVETEWPLRIQLPAGSRVPFYCTASGKMYLSTLDHRELQAYLDATRLEPRAPGTYTQRKDLEAAIHRARARGYATDRGEFMRDMIALAVPVNDQNGRLLATLSFHAPTLRIDLEHALSFLPHLQEAARELAALVKGVNG
ncbi:transcriptional regulator, IclR family [Jannaschia faecimaris]|uniref:Transcriptional regulator, IclR family n=1 Tax=Jannaschia faecimaris TaxID=1244108 RepID=A0A1H3JVC2_9RHOB|nr:IclR family transcriptional regulator [Jannaschia faecimaris]SDY43569.1 transcriptional regulator, IclR family [Jannaschia faecimaris]